MTWVISQTVLVLYGDIVLVYMQLSHPPGDSDFMWFSCSELVMLLLIQWPVRTLLKSLSFFISLREVKAPVSKI